ncbi:MAG: Tyrosine-specific transport protein [Chlamydiales bacterium]|nr:Tyrosine-specific transport protein [Chlamydiales bacterium]
MELSKGGSLFGGALLVAGTAIGGGMLALPVLTAAGGFLPAVIVYILCWLFMTATGLLFLEVALWTQKEINIVSMAKMTLGNPGKIAAWLLYLYFFYSLTVAYISGGGDLVSDVAKLSNSPFLPWMGPLIFVVIFAPIVIIGARAVDRLNSLLMGGLILSFLILVLLGMWHIDLNLWKRVDISASLLATPVVFTSFGFQGIVPTLTNYLNRNVRLVRKAIIIGSSIPLIAYIIWEGLILGVIPLEQLEQTRIANASAVAPLKNILEFPWLYRLGEIFAFCALVTSFLGVTLGFTDFLADGLKIKKNVWGRLRLGLLIFGPPLIFAMMSPSIFVDALHYAGGLGSALLLGLLPILMVWRGRYKLGLKGEYSLFGNRFILSLLILFVVLELIFMFLKIYR